MFLRLSLASYEVSRFAVRKLSVDWKRQAGNMDLRRS